MELSRLKILTRYGLMRQICVCGLVIVGSRLDAQLAPSYYLNQWWLPIMKTTQVILRFVLFGVNVLTVSVNLVCKIMNRTVTWLSKHDHGEYLKSSLFLVIKPVRLCKLGLSKTCHLWITVNRIRTIATMQFNGFHMGISVFSLSVNLNSWCFTRAL